MLDNSTSDGSTYHELANLIYPTAGGSDSRYGHGVAGGQGDSLEVRTVMLGPCVTGSGVVVGQTLGGCERLARKTTPDPFSSSGGVYPAAIGRFYD